jgi:hypothetical protein
MGKASARKKIARRAPRARVQRKLFTPWNLTVSAVVILGVLVVALSRNNDSLYGTPAGVVGPAINEHWHAAYGVDLCGVWQPAIPTWESVAGLHTHGDGLLHIHPFSSRGEFENATIEHLLDPPDGDVQAGTDGPALRYEFNPGQIVAKGKDLVLQGETGDFQIPQTTVVTVPATTTTTAATDTTTAGATTTPASTGDTSATTAATTATTTAATTASSGGALGEPGAPVLAQAASTTTAATTSATTATTAPAPTASTAGPTPATVAGETTTTVAGETTTTVPGETTTTAPGTIPTKTINKWTLTNGDKCDSHGGREGKLRWAVGKYDRAAEAYTQPPTEQTGDLTKYVLQDGDVITIAFLPEDVPLGAPPGAENALLVSAGIDGGATAPAGTDTSVPDQTVATVPGESTSTVPGDTSASTASTATGDTSATTTATTTAATTGGT